ncbi:trigger factor [Buchnera aphidicola (Macrosiphoniella sanborni)]|uniref:Trigger factor n=1 Tax=Buchnera aphidicola (Macrosiphoniella sanborni) TaxID=1241865 RepID=A0A4D6Y622_9GAMM|nr:trigger factor [Buchnera aphidicola]QCI23983.1 trigger factor [Buchnera aphidicola (Macrosiphoniella sanborni)]
MKFVMEKLKDAGHRVTINIPKTIIDNSVLKEFIKISKTKNINGFRKGKIPIKFIEKEYGDAIYYDIFKQLMQKFFYEFIREKNIKIIGAPRYYIHENQDKIEKQYKYSVIYEIYPQFKIDDIKNIEVNKIDVQIKNEDIRNSIIKNKLHNIFWKKVNRPIQLNDRVTIDYYVYKNRFLIQQFNKKNFIFIVSHNTLIPQLKYKIINRVINDIFFFKIKLHQLHPEKKLQNKEIICKIKIIQIEAQDEKKIYEKNIIKKTLETIDYLNIKQNISLQINQITDKYLEDQIIEQIIKKNIISIPPLLFEQYKQTIYKKFVKQYEEENANILEKKYHYNIDIQVKKKLCMKILLEKIISDNKIFLDEKYMQSLIKKISLNYQKPKEIIYLYNNNKNFQNTIKNIELKNQAMILLKKRIKIIKKYWNFDYFINYNWATHEEFIF